MTRVIHTADTHIGYRQYHSTVRRGDFLAAFEAVVADAIEEDLDAVVHAGDLFHDRRPALEDVMGTVGALRELREAGVPFLAVVGNHEGTRDAQWLDLFERLGLATRLGTDPERVGNTAFYGLDYAPSPDRDPDHDFAPVEADHVALVAHGQFEPLAEYAERSVEPVLEASPVAVDAALLGDDHQPDRTQVGETWVTYSGSTERASAAERDQRGYNIVEFEDGVRITRRGIDTRRFEFLDLDLEGEEDTEYVRRRLREFDLEGAVAVVTLEGGGGEVVPAEIERAGDEAGAVVTRVNDRREREDAPDETDVRFTDPDEAVRERVEAMPLSRGGRELDDLVRDAGIADTNVRERVESRVRELLETDADALVAPEGGEAAPEGAGETPLDAGQGADTPDDADTEHLAETVDPTAETGASGDGDLDREEDGSNEDDEGEGPQATTMEDYL